MRDEQVDPRVVQDLPADKLLRTYMRQAAELVESGQRKKSIDRRPKKTTKQDVRVPAELRAALKKNKVAAKAVEGFSASCQREYAEGITEAIRIEKILDNGSHIIIDEKAWQGEFHDYLKTINGEREIDLPENVAKLLVEFIGNVESGLLFRTRKGKQLLDRTSYAVISTLLLRKSVLRKLATTHSVDTATPSFATTSTVQRASLTSGWVGVKLE